MDSNISKSLFSILLLLISCMDKEKSNRKGYEIIGRVKNISASRIYMNAMVLDSAGQPKWPIIDSADYVNETFVLKRDTLLLEPAWATQIFYIDSATKKTSSLSFNNQYLSTKEKPSLYGDFILENAKVDIEGDAKDKNGLKLIGSKETDFLFKYSLMSPPDKVYKISRKIDSALQTFDTSLLVTYKKQKDSLLKNYKTSFTKIISEHPSDFQAISNIYNNASFFTPDELQTLIEKLDKQLLETPTGKKLITFIGQGRLLLPGSIFPNFNYNDTTGKKINLNDVKGDKGTLIVFWASWCTPCRQEIPELKKLYDQYNSKGFSIVNISVDNDERAWKNALLKEQMAWTNISNLPGYYADIYSKYNIKGIPLMFLLNSNNKILLANPQSIEEIKEKLHKERVI